MKINIQISAVVYVMFFFAGCTQEKNSPEFKGYTDKPFISDYSIKYLVREENVRLYKVESDRNGYIQILSSNGLLRPANGQFLYPGYLVNDNHYRPTALKRISGIGTYNDQIV